MRMGEEYLTNLSLISWSMIMNAARSWRWVCPYTGATASPDKVETASGCPVVIWDIRQGGEVPATLKWFRERADFDPNPQIRELSLEQVTDGSVIFTDPHFDKVKNREVYQQFLRSVSLTYGSILLRMSLQTFESFLFQSGELWDIRTDMGIHLPGSAERITWTIATASKFREVFAGFITRMMFSDEIRNLLSDEERQIVQWCEDFFEEQKILDEVRNGRILQSQVISPSNTSTLILASLMYDGDLYGDGFYEEARDVSAPFLVSELGYSILYELALARNNAAFVRYDREKGQHFMNVSLDAATTDLPDSIPVNACGAFLVDGIEGSWNKMFTDFFLVMARFFQKLTQEISA